MFKIITEMDKETITEWFFSVDLTTKQGKNSYTVSIGKDYFKKLTGGSIPPVVLIKQSFIFLLEREQASAILRDFDIGEIEHYFPEYREVMKSMIV